MVAQPNLSPSLNGLSTYPLEKLLGMWKSGSISLEQLAGYLLQHVVLLEKRLAMVEKSVPPGSAHGAPAEKEHLVG